MPAEDSGDGAAVTRAFGAENRRRLIDAYLDDTEAVTPDTAWLRVYELLLWIDRSTGLAHCYESDKCQPGRPWYARSLAFHDWLADAFGLGAGELGESLDWLFRRAIVDFAAGTHEERLRRAADQLLLYAGRDMPVPGEDPELVAIIAEALENDLRSPPSDETWQRLTEQVQGYLGQANKRNNLLGEGFEDTLAALIRRLPGADKLTIVTRTLLGDIPGFQPQGEAEKQKRVDLAVWGPDGRRHLVTSKWSVRSDREEQFGTDFDAYVRVNTGAPFEHVLVTNEFDAARLKAACTRLSGNAHLFSAVVHVNPVGVLTAYGSSRRGAAGDLPDLVKAGRLISLERWLESIA